MVAFKSIGTAFTTGSNATFTANVPTGGGAPVSGDLLVAIGIDWAGTGVTWTTPVSPLWTLQKNANDAATGDIGIHVYTRTAGASEANQNFTLSAAEEGIMVMLCYSSPDPTTPVDTTGATMTDPATASSTLTTPVVTTTVANDVLLLIYGLGSDGGVTPAPTLSTPGSTTNRLATTSVAATNFWTVLNIDEIVQAASGNSAQYSSSSTGNATATYGAGAVVVALKGPATAGIVGRLVESLQNTQGLILQQAVRGALPW